MKLLSSLDELKLTVSKLDRDTTTVIGIEGASTSGKTTLSRTLADVGGYQVLSTDDFYRTGSLGKTYVEGLRLQELRAQWQSFASAGEALIIEGICLRDTLDAMESQATVFIYSKRISSAGLWHDDPALSDGISTGSGSTQEQIDLWSHEYHVRKRPHLIADIMFEWSTDAS